MIQKSKAVLMAAVLVLSSLYARAEQDEMTAGIKGGLVLPSYQSKSQSAFAMATWNIGAFFAYGLFDDLYLGAAFTFSTFDAQKDGYKTNYEGLDYEGTLRFDARMYHPELGLKYKLYAGYNLAPYIEAWFGYAWSTYLNPTLHDQDGRRYDIEVGDFGEGVFTLKGGLSVDYRLFNMIFAGAGVYFTWTVGDSVLEYTLEVPVYFAYYW